MKHLLTRLYRWITRLPLCLTAIGKQFQAQHDLSNHQMKWLIVEARIDGLSWFNYLWNKPRKEPWNSTSMHFSEHDFYEDKDTP